MNCSAFSPLNKQESKAKIAQFATEHEFKLSYFKKNPAELATKCSGSCLQIVPKKAGFRVAVVRTAKFCVTNGIFQVEIAATASTHRCGEAVFPDAVLIINIGPG
jgi:hypothetical protein